MEYSGAWMFLRNSADSPEEFRLMFPVNSAGAFMKCSMSVLQMLPEHSTDSFGVFWGYSRRILWMLLKHFKRCSQRISQILLERSEDAPGAFYLRVPIDFVDDFEEFCGCSRSILAYITRAFCECFSMFQRM